MSRDLPDTATQPQPAGMVLFLGMVRRGEFESLQRHGLKLGVLVDTNSKHQLGDVSDFIFVERFDFSRPLPELIATVRDIHARQGVACLFNVMEFYVLETAAVAEALGFPGILPAAAQLCRDKSVMRQRFHERIGPKAAAQFEVIHSEAELLVTAESFGYPVFLQPSNVAASMWSSRNSDPETLLANYRAMLDGVPKYYAQLGKKDARLEVVLAEFLPGNDASVDCVVDATGEVFVMPVVDVLKGQDVGIDDYHHFARILPSHLNAAEQETLQRLAVAGVQALDMKSCAAHVEFIGTRLGEIAARPGGNRARILELACAMDELFACYQVLCGQRPNLRCAKNLAAGILTPYARRDGKLRAIRHLDHLAQLPTYLYHEVRAQAGSSVGLAKNGGRAPLYIELQSPDAAAVRRDVEEIASWTDLYELE